MFVGHPVYEIIGKAQSAATSIHLVEQIAIGIIAVAPDPHIRVVHARLTTNNIIGNHCCERNRWRGIQVNGLDRSEIASVIIVKVGVAIVGIGRRGYYRRNQ